MKQYNKNTAYHKEKNTDSVTDEEIQVEIQEPETGEAKTVWTCLKWSKDIAGKFEASIWVEVCQW